MEEAVHSQQHPPGDDPNVEDDPRQQPQGKPSGSRGRGASSGLERFSERTRQVFARAEAEARRHNHAAIRPEHLLLALLNTGRPPLTPLATGPAIAEVNALRAALEERLGRGDAAAGQPVALASACKQAIALAVEEARRVRHSRVEPEHLLLGIVRAGKGLDKSLLTGVLVHVMRQSLFLAKLHEPVVGPPMTGPMSPPGGLLPPLPPAAAGGTRDNVVTMRIGDADLAAVDALVEVGISKSRSEAAAWLLSCGVAANRPLFAKAEHLISEVRRLREEAQQLAQEHGTGGQGQPPPHQEPPQQAST